MRRPTFQQTQPLAGTDVLAYCAGLRGYKDARSPADALEGLIARAFLPRRLANKRAARILHEHRMNGRRWASLGNVDVATMMPMAAAYKAFTRYPVATCNKPCGNAGQS